MRDLSRPPRYLLLMLLHYVRGLNRLLVRAREVTTTAAIDVVVSVLSLLTISSVLPLLFLEGICLRTLAAAVAAGASAPEDEPAALHELPRPPHTKGALAHRKKFRSTRSGRAAVAGSPRESVRTIAAAAAAAVLAAACCCRRRTQPLWRRLCATGLSYENTPLFYFIFPHIRTLILTLSSAPET